MKEYRENVIDKCIARVLKNIEENGYVDTTDREEISKVHMENSIYNICENVYNETVITEGEYSVNSRVYEELYDKLVGNHYEKNALAGCGDVYNERYYELINGIYGKDIINIIVIELIYRITVETDIKEIQKDYISKENYRNSKGNRENYYCISCLLNDEKYISKWENKYEERGYITKLDDMKVLLYLLI